MPDHIVQISEDFYNLRGSFKIGFLDVGTQTSLVRRASGDFVLLDSYTLEGEVLEEVMQLTDGGKLVSAVLNLHPFHTLHVRPVAKLFPQARLFGTRRHVARETDLRWEKVHTEDPELTELFGDDFEFSRPGGVEFIPDNENLHFASVLALHKASGTLHVDDTFTWSTLPLMKGLRLHPTLGKVLEKRPGAADEFNAWAKEMETWASKIKTICPAHLRPLPPTDTPIKSSIEGAFARSRKTVSAHQKRFG